MAILIHTVGAGYFALRNNYFMPKTATKTLGQRVKFFRKQRGLYQVELADITGVSTGYIGSIEQGVRTPSLQLLKKLAKALKISPSELI